MQYGHFDDEAREYIIDTPATPLPWINYLGSENFFSLISNTAGGYSFYKDAKLRRITRYRYNDVPADSGARNYYISLMDGDAEAASPIETWSPAFLPAKTPLDSYRCRHGLGYSVFESSLHGVASSLTAFVPLKANAEINRLDVTNTNDFPIVLDITGSVEWCLWNAVDDSTNFQRNLSTGEVEIERNDDSTLLYHKTEFKERRDHYAFFGVNAATSGFDTDRDSFLGIFNGWDTPQAITEGRAHDSVAHGWYPIAANRVRIRLMPGERSSLVFTLGYVEVDPDEKWDGPASAGIINKRPAHELFARFNTVEKVDAAFRQLREHWTTLLGTYKVSSTDAKLDRMVNIWHQYQCMVTFNMSRSASYYESGTGRGMGFRDSNQDILGFVHLIPERARERIIDIASTQLDDGSAWHQYQPLTKQGNAEIGGGFNDDPLWLIAAVHAYLAETGDVSILTEEVPFNNAEGTQSPLLEHLRRSVAFTLTHTGPHKLPLIGRADWNDCLNLNCFSKDPGESFQTVENINTDVAESVFIAGMFVLYGGQYADIIERYGSACSMSTEQITKETASVRTAVRVMSETVETAGWDGQWFLRAYDAYSHPVGSHADPEGSIYIEPQGMCVMAGIGVQDGKAARALQSVTSRLTSEWGTAILAPAYSTYRIELGEISTYPAGYKENGGIFCHNNPWISIANALIGDDEEAFAIYRRNCPAYVEEHSDIRKVEPYVYSQMVAGPEAANPGEGKNSWLTGTAAWTFVNVSQYLLGIRPTLDGLSVEPHLPGGFDDLSVTRVYRGVTYHIALRRSGERTLSVDGQSVDGSTVPLPDEGVTTVNVLSTF
ncbi:GH36-type glycosyl hydrolase domain-containing protein [Bifidobacterium psychraerophilum]|uniref:Glycosyl transferase family 36 n=1 Tax=Bifidobacterium psychraerophilum TaxID=218140 RepID=A0A087CM32_9BIFI|nr:glycosyl transferase [Bifidobacterium psychraerophilum]KFI84332.1 glycosyl transferase family 36 [Bifidobacterium psychraerophilum]PKA94188.1 cellobiose phosphorylase [Bifidobacterium psychraerophilum DSM 22366]